MPIECILKMVSKLMKFCRHKKNSFPNVVLILKINIPTEKIGIKKIKLLFSPSSSSWTWVHLNLTRTEPFYWPY